MVSRSGARPARLSPDGPLLARYLDLETFTGEVAAGLVTSNVSGPNSRRVARRGRARVLGLADPLLEPMA
jgi:hypothetical protein